MALIDVQLGPGGIIRHEAPTVYTRARWQDKWVRDDSLVVTDVAWSCLPTMPTASLVLHYGKVRWFDDTTWVTRQKLKHMARRYVKVVVPMQDDGTGAFANKTWFGVFQLVVDVHEGAVFAGGADALASGVQQLTAYGMESLLNSHYVRGAWFEFSGGATLGEAAIPFNRRGRGNRSTAKIGDAYVFTDVTSFAPNWSSQDVAEYMLANHAPKDSTGATAVPFRLHSSAWLPTWDAPQIDTTDQTTLGILSRIASRQRLLSAWFDVSDSNYVELHTDTIVPAAVSVSIPGVANAKIPANGRQLKIISDDDQATHVSVKDSDLPVYDVVVAQGAPEVSVGTFSLPDATLDVNWNSTEESDYESGASAVAGYGALSLKNKQKANAAARSSPKFERVFSYFAIPRTWDQECKNGEASTASNPMFPLVAGGVTQVYYPTMFVESQLPLLAGADYSAATISSGTTGETADMLERLPPLVFFKSPDDARWMRIEDIGTAADLEIETAAKFGAFSIYAHVPPESHGFTLRVAGAPQHAIAYGDFTRLTDVDPDSGQWTFRTGMCATLAISSGRKLQARYPETDPIEKDAIRTYYLDVGDSFEAVYVVPQTVVGVEIDGTLKRSNGGWMYRPADSVEHLAALAKIAASWYTAPHYVATIETERLTTEIGLGDLIARVGDSRGDNPHQIDANAPVTEIRVEWPLSRGGQVETPRMTVSTFAGELDPVQVSPAAPSIHDIDWAKGGAK